MSERHSSRVGEGRQSLRPSFHLWLENVKRQIVVDQTDAMLLRQLVEKNSLTEAAKSAGISYRNAWDRIKTLEKNLGQKIVQTKVGGRTGGGTTLSAEGIAILREFRKMRKFLFTMLGDRETWEDISYRLSARNRLRARIINIERGTTTSAVKMRINAPVTLTSIITNEAVDELSLGKEDLVEAIVKSTDVIVAKKESGPS